MLTLVPIMFTETTAHQSVEFLIDLGERTFVSGLHYDREFGYYFDDVRAKYAMQHLDPRIKEIYLIKRK